MKKTINITIILLMLLSLVATSFAADDSASIVVSVQNQEPDPANPGDIIDIWLGFENLGGKAVNDIVMNVVNSYPFSPLSGQEVVEVGSISAYQSGDSIKIVKIKTQIDSQVKAGIYNLEITYKSVNDVNAITKVIPIEVESSNGAEVIHIDKTILVPGQETPLTFVINNVGSNPLNDLTFTWVSEGKVILPVGSDNRKFIDYIDVGESAELKYTVIADTRAEVGLYELNLNLNYDDSLGSKSIETIAGVYIGGETDFDVSFSENTNGAMALSVANIGNNPAYSVAIKIPKQDSWKTSGTSSSIVGNLNNGDYTVASFILVPLVPGNPLIVDLVYTDTQGIRHTIEKEVNIGSSGSSIMGSNTASSTNDNTAPTGTRIPGMGRVSTDKAATTNTAMNNLVIVGGIVFVIIGGVVLFKRKRRGKWPFNKNK